MLFVDKKRRQFEALFQPHLDAAYNLARYLCGNSTDAEDIVQEVYLKAYRAFDNYANDNSRAWILTITRNTCYSWWRKNKNNAGQVFDDNSYSPGNHHQDFFATHNESPEKFAEHADLQQYLKSAIAALPIEFREVFVLRQLEDLSYDEISTILDIPRGTVMSRLARARARLQQPLTKIGIQDKA